MNHHTPAHLVVTLVVGLVASLSLASCTGNDAQPAAIAQRTTSPEWFPLPSTTTDGINGTDAIDQGTPVSGSTLMPDSMPGIVQQALRRHNPDALASYVGSAFILAAEGADSDPWSTADASAVLTQLAATIGKEDGGDSQSGKVIGWIDQEWNTDLSQTAVIGSRTGVFVCCLRRPGAASTDAKELALWEFRDRGAGVSWQRWLWLGAPSDTPEDTMLSWLRKGEWNTDRAHGFGQSQYRRVAW